jgi:transketolase
MYQHETAVYERRFQAFGWDAVSVDGHSVSALKAAFAKARSGAKPFAVIARTFKGKGVSFLEDKEGWHGKPVKKGEELQKAVAELGDTSVTLTVEARRYAASKPPVAAAPPSLTPAYTLGQEVATREAYGAALAKLAKSSPVVTALDGDTKNSTFSEKIKEVDPNRHVECYIAEQQMVGAALGLSTEGRIPYASTFACFFTRAYDFIRMAAISRPKHLVLVGSHAGVSIGEDGPSQMALEDLAMMRAINGAAVLYPSDAVCAERLVEAAGRHEGIVYIRTSRPKTKVLYSNEEYFPIGQSKTLRSSANDRITLVGAGVTLYEALDAADALAKDGIAARVIDLYSLKPVDTATLQKAARETKAFVTVEDHSVCGGVGESVASAVAGLASVTMLGVTSVPRSGKPRELMEKNGITAKDVVAAAKRVLGA